jgi:predicted acetyltransferase
MELDVRSITDAEVAAWCGALNRGFYSAGGDTDAEARRPGLILDRTLAGFDGDRIVSTLRSFPAELTVPGGRFVPTSAVTAVTTSTTHRRRGLATRMIHADLTAAIERGEPAAILITAEWPIYGRYGYGACTEHQTLTIDAGQARLRHRPPGTVEFVEVAEARALAPAIFERHRAARPGEITRDDRTFDLNFGLLRFPSWPEPKHCFHVLARDEAGTPVGVLSYRFDERWEHRQPQTTAHVERFISAGPAADALLWQHLLSLDLVRTIVAEDRPPVDPLPWLLADARDAVPSDRSDFLWLRPLDVPHLLTTRTYPQPGRLVLQVEDKAGYAAGRYALDAGPDGATCTRTDAPADLTLDVSALGSVYLGGYAVSALAAAGLVEEHTPGAVGTADSLFRGTVPPWCSTWF